jgi:hypothetical protein
MSVYRISMRRITLRRDWRIPWTAILPQMGRRTTNIYLPVHFGLIATMGHSLSAASVFRTMQVEGSSRAGHCRAAPANSGE